MNRFLTGFALAGGLALAAHLAQPAAAQPSQSELASPVLTNGVTFLPVVDRTSPRVAFSLVLRAGAADETPQTAGWRRLLINAMLRSAPRGYETSAPAGSIESTESLARAAEKLGGSIGATVGDDTVEIWAIGSSANGTELLRLALALLENPRLSDADIDAARERTRVVSEGSPNLSSRIDEGLRGQIFRTPAGDKAAYGLPELGNDESLDYLTNAKIRDFQAVLNSSKLTVGAVGDVDADAEAAILAMRGAKARREAAAPIFVTPDKNAPAFSIRQMPVQAAGLFTSFPFGVVAPADKPVVRVLVAALTDAQGARLAKRLLNAKATEENQVSSVSAQWIERRYGSELIVSSQTSPQAIDKTKNALIDEVMKFKTVPLSKMELERARIYARGSWSLDHQNIRDRAYLVALPPTIDSLSDASWPGRIAAVTAADVQRVAKKYLGAYAVALVMPREE